MTFILLLVPAKSVRAQWYVVVDDSEIRAVWEMFQQVVPKRSGDFATRQECEDALDQSDWMPGQRAKYWCECETNCDDQNSSGSYNDGQQNSSVQNPPEIMIDDYETQMMKRDLLIEKDKKEKAALEKLKNDNIKNDLLTKLKGNKSLNQLKTTSGLSEQGLENITNNQTDAGRDDTESAFSQGKIKLKKGRQNNTVPVSQPVPVEQQKNLFEYIDRETKVVQTKIMDVQKKKIQLLEKKNQIQEKIVEQTVNIQKLKEEKYEAKDETRKEEIDSLLIMATQMLQESETLDQEANKELEVKDKLVKDQEGLLNKYQETYNKSKDNPELSEELLKELQGDKK